MRHITELRVITRDAALTEVRLRCVEQEFECFKKAATECLERHCAKAKALSGEIELLQVENRGLRSLLRSSGYFTEEKITDILSRDSGKRFDFVAEPVFEIAPPERKPEVHQLPSFEEPPILLLSELTAMQEPAGKPRSVLRSTGKITQISELPHREQLTLAVGPVGHVVDVRERKPSMGFHFSHFRVAGPHQPPILHLQALPVIAVFRAAR
jgi:hypothetical protein